MWSAPETELEAASEVGSLVDIKIRERNVNKHDVGIVIGEAIFMRKGK